MSSQRILPGNREEEGSHDQRRHRLLYTRANAPLSALGWQLFVSFLSMAHGAAQAYKVAGAKTTAVGVLEIPLYSSTKVSQV